MKKKFVWAMVAATAACFAVQVQVQATETSWNYMAYDRDGMPLSPGYVTLVEDGGTAKVRILAGSMARCFATDLDATVERSTEKVLIVVEPRLVGCAKLRFVLKADGTGGQRQYLSGGAWVPDGKDRVLTRRD